MIFTANAGDADTGLKLIEMIDNANNMAILKLWEPIRDLLSSSHQEIIRHAAWICGTAVQNNLKAQAAVSFTIQCNYDVEERRSAAPIQGDKANVGDSYI